MSGYPNTRANAAGAMPVYYVAAPINPPYPNNQNFIGAAIPVITTGVVGLRAIPVRVTTQAAAGFPFSNDQGQNSGAIPVYESIAPNAMPVWHV